MQDLILSNSKQIHSNLITFAQISIEFFSNLIKFAQISPPFCPNLINFSQQIFTKGCGNISCIIQFLRQCSLKNTANKILS